MSFSEAFNGGMTIILASSAVVSSFFLPAEIPVILLLLSYPTAIYAIGLMAGNANGNYEGALSFFWKLMLVTIIVFSIIYWRYGLISENEEVDISFFEGIYFSITTLTTLGYGDFAPTARIRHITSVQAILGYIALGLWVGLINRQISGFDKLRQDINEHNANLVSQENSDEKSAE